MIDTDNILQLADRLEREARNLRVFVARYQRATAKGEMESFLRDIDKINADRKTRGAPPILPLITDIF